MKVIKANMDYCCPYTRRKDGEMGFRAAIIEVPLGRGYSQDVRYMVITSQMKGAENWSYTMDPDQTFIYDTSSAEEAVRVLRRFVGQQLTLDGDWLEPASHRESIDDEVWKHWGPRNANPTWQVGWFWEEPDLNGKEIKCLGKGVARGLKAGAAKGISWEIPQGILTITSSPDQEILVGTEAEMDEKLGSVADPELEI